jgi:hypothetical protein
MEAVPVFERVIKESKPEFPFRKGLSLQEMWKRALISNT